MIRLFFLLLNHLHHLTHNFTSSSSTANGRWWGEADLQVTADQNRVSTTRLEQATPGYELVNLQAGSRLGDQWSVLATVSNVFDEAYARHLNTLNPFTRQRIQDAGRSVRLSLRWSR